MPSDSHKVPDCAAVSDCHDCATTLALVQADGRPRRCVCGAEFCPTPELTLVAPTLALRRLEGPSAPRRESVYRADPDAWPQRRRREDPVERVETAPQRTARLISELQVDLTGRSPTAPAVSSLGARGIDYGRVIVQSSPQWTAPALPAPERPQVIDTIDARAERGSEVWRTLHWLRANASPAPLLGDAADRALLDLQSSLGYELAPPEIRARFDADSSVLHQGAPIRGRWAIDAAMKAWWA